MLSLCYIAIRQKQSTIDINHVTSHCIHTKVEVHTTILKLMILFSFNTIYLFFII